MFSRLLSALISSSALHDVFVLYVYPCLQGKVEFLLGDNTTEPHTSHALWEKCTIYRVVQDLCRVIHRDLLVIGPYMLYLLILDVCRCAGQLPASFSLNHLFLFLGLQSQCSLTISNYPEAIKKLSQIWPLHTVFHCSVMWPTASIEKSALNSLKMYAYSRKYGLIQIYVFNYMMNRIQLHPFDFIKPMKIEGR